MPALVIAPALLPLSTADRRCRRWLPDCRRRSKQHGTGTDHGRARKPFEYGGAKENADAR